MNMVHKLQQHFFFSFKSQMLFENIKLDNWKRISFALIIWRHDNISFFLVNKLHTSPSEGWILILSTNFSIKREFPVLMIIDCC